MLALSLAAIGSAQAAGTFFTTFQAASVVIGQTNFTSQDTNTSQVVTPGPVTVAISAQGKLAVGDLLNGRVLIWNSIPTANGTPADVVVGKPDFTNTTSGCTASLCSAISSVTFSPDGSKLIVNDDYNTRVLIWNSVPTTNGQPADVVIGQTNFNTATGGIASNKLNNGVGVLVAPNGKLLIADFSNSRILIFNSLPTTNNASADVVIGQTNMTTATTGTAANQMNLPSGVAYSSEGKLLVTDELNNRVLVFNNLPATNGASADLVIGQAAFGFKNAGTTVSNFYHPTGLALSPSGTLAIEDFGNNRVLIFNFIPTTNGASADVVLGQPNFTSSTAFNGGINANSFNHPYQAAFTTDGRLLVAGRDMSRVMIFTGQQSPLITAQPTNQTVLAGSNAVFTVTALGAAPLAYQWQFNGTNADTATNATLIINLVEATNVGNYQVIITNSIGSVTSVVVNLNILWPPQGFVAYSTNTGQLSLRFAGTPNFPYVLQSATNLTPPVNWQPIFTNPADGSGNWQFTDTNLNSGQRFYRALGQ